jgi:flagellar hook assembly protein FlgD
VSLVVFDQLGREVRTLVSQVQSAGLHYAQWDGKDGSGKALASGVYLYRLQSGSTVQSKQMLLMK